MLTPQQIQTIKTSNTNGGVSPDQAMSPEQFKSWSKPESGSHSFLDSLNNIYQNAIVKPSKGAADAVAGGLKDFGDAFHEVQSAGDVKIKDFKSAGDFINKAGGGALDMAGAGVRTIFNAAGAPVNIALGAAGNVPTGDKKNVGDRANDMIKPIADYLGSQPIMQEIAQIPNIDKHVQSFIDVVTPLLLAHLAAKNGSSNGQPTPEENVLHEQNAKAAQQLENSKVLEMGDKTGSGTDLASIHAEEKAITDYANAKPGARPAQPNTVTSMVTGGLESAANKVSDIAQVSKDMLQKPDVPAELLPKNTATPEPVQTNIDAINLNPKGVKLAGAYKQVVTGGRDITPPSAFSEQNLTPDQQTINLGTRLSNALPDVGSVELTNNPVKDLDVLGSSLEKTETKINTALEGDPTLQYNADKMTLSKTLNNLNVQMPREFSSIRDSKSVFNNVVKFAQETLKTTDDSIKGLRAGRTAFDTQAKMEYPSAYKNGSIDVASPAGRAIKMVRDAWNSHIYNTAPNGSEIRTLIAREADIFRAADTVAQKAAKGQGMNSIEQLIKAHPTLSRYIKYGLIGLGVDKTVKTLTGVGF